MPLLAGLFHKRNTTPRYAKSESGSNRDSADGDYVPADKPIYDLPRTDSSTKFRLPFRRKQSVTHTDPKSVVSLNDAPSSPLISSVMSDSGHVLPPPPRKSSLFAIYNYPRHSVLSLPNESSSQVHSDTPPRLSLSDVRTESRLPPSQLHKKTPGFLSWARERTKSKPPPPSASISSVTLTSPSGDDSSFNLKSFRHVRADSPSTSPEKLSESSLNLLPPAHLRSRGDSVASDSSQRISVAAFKEAQARSRANSPAPSSRPPSTADTLRIDVNGRKRASTLSAISPTDPQINKNVSIPSMPGTRPGSSAGSSSSPESSEDEEVDSDGEPIQKPTRNRTITRRTGGIRSRSDTGHGPVTTPLDRVSPLHVPQIISNSAPLLTYQSDQSPFVRRRASASTSALTPIRAARRASISAAANSSSSSFRESRRLLQKLSEGSEEPTDSSDAESEDMPLRDLVAPRRPRSSASNSSSIHSRMPAKPLIDINSLVGGPPALKPILRHHDSLKSTKLQEQDAEKDQPFSIPAALTCSSSTSPPITPSVSKQNATPSNKATSPTQHRRSSSDVLSPVKSEGPDHDDDLMNAIRLVGVLDKEQDQSSGTTMPSDHIVPTPIREREPPTSFTVLSRPHRRSFIETSASPSPVPQTHTVTTSSAPPPELGARQRTVSMAKFSAESDESDVMSIASVARSTRSSSRIPLVPLIHSIPDSPSVKEDYKPGRPRSALRTSAVEAPRPPPPAPSNKRLSRTSQPPPMPQRPFANNRPVRGESPAGSSTGDSSSGRAPFTPRDGSDIGARSKDADMDSTLKVRGHAKRPTVTFEDSQPVRGRERAKTDLTVDQRTRERRRGEAKAALELGKIVNGRGPLVHEDSDEGMPRGRNPKINVTTENGANRMMPGWTPWQQQMGNSMVPPQFNNDPAYIAAHQHALLVAKQAYQMAVAQHAMQMAGEEWERSSNIAFGSGGSAYGGGSRGSVYGGGSRGSVYGSGGASMGPMPMMGMNMLMPPNQWGRSSVAFPGSTGSVYGGISGSQSEYGGGGGGGWGPQSVYGNSSGSSSRVSFVGNNEPNNAASAHGSTSRPRASTGGLPPPSSSSSRTPGKAPAARGRVGPPSSWKNGTAQ